MGHLAVIDTAGLEDFEQVIRDCDPAQTQPGLYRITAPTPHMRGNRARAWLRRGRSSRSTEEVHSPAATRLRMRRQNWARSRGYCASINSPVLSGFTRLAANNLGGILADEDGSW